MLPSVTVDYSYTAVFFPSEERKKILWFFRENLIAFQTVNGRVFKRRNIWGPPTHYLLQWLPDGPSLSGGDFEDAYQEHWNTIKGTKE